MESNYTDRFGTNTWFSKPTGWLRSTYLEDVASSLSERFWQHSGTLQRYINFMLREVDPLFDRQQLTAQVVRIEQETEEAISLWLRPSKRWSGFKAGQFIAIQCEMNGALIRRNYSISCSPETFKTHGLISITVKAVENGRVSNFLNHELLPSQYLRISDAMGAFTLPSQQAQSEHNPTALGDLLFIAAGSGVTPIKSMIEHRIHQIETGQALPEAMQLIYYSNRSDDGIFIGTLQALAQQYDYLSVTHHVTERDGFIDQATLLKDCNDVQKRAVYLCGPEGFMTSVQTICQSLGMPAEQVQKESFGAVTTVAATSGLPDDLKENPLSVSFAFADKQVSMSEPTSLLALAEQAGLTPKYGCRNGICHECKCQRPAGVLVNQISGEMIPEDQALVQSCITMPVSDITLEQW